MERLTIFFWGVMAATGQIYLLREYLVAAGGNELSIGIFFAAWLTGVAAGALAAGRVGGRRVTGWLFGFTVIAWVLFPCVVLALRLAPALFGVTAGMRLTVVQSAFLSLVSVLPFAAVIGAYFPAASRLLAGPGDDGPGGVGSAYWIEGAGMAAGSLGATFVLVPSAGPVAGLWAVFAMVFLAWTPVARAPRRLRIAAGILGAALLVQVIAGPAASLDERSAAARFAALKTGFARIGGLNTEYARYDLGERAGQFALFINGQFAAAFPDEYSSAAKAHLCMSEADNPRRVLLLGAVSFGLVRHLLEQGATAVDYVETDPGLLPFLRRAANTPLLPDDPRVRVHHADGRAFVKRAAPGAYDLVIADVPDPSTAGLNRYYTRDFFLEVQRLLGPGGVFATGIGSSVTYLSAASASRLGSVYRALSGAFPHVVVAPGERAYLFATGRDRLLSQDWMALRDRYLRSGAADPAFVPESLSAFFPEGQADELARRLAGGDAPVNTDLRPAAYFFNLVLWDWTTGEGFSPRLGALAGVTPALVLWALVLIFTMLAAITVARRPSPMIPASAVIVVAGGFGMGAGLLCLFAFQNIAGSIYSHVGLVLGLYLAGMTIGGYAGLVSVRTRDLPHAYLRLVVAMAGCACVAGCIPGLHAALAGASPASAVAAFSALAALAGGLSGFCFPLAAAVVANRGYTPPGAAAIVDGLDCLGAAAGGLLTGVVLIPVLGVHGAALALSTACVLAGALALVPISRTKSI